MSIPSPSESTFEAGSTHDVVGGARTVIAGDEDPQDFKFEEGLSAKEVLALIERNSKARKLHWFVDQAFKLGIEFKKDKTVDAPKFDNEHFIFETFLDWIKWTKSYMEIKKGIKWAEDLGVCINLFFITEEKPGIYKNTKLPFYDKIKDGESFASTKAVYKRTNAIGYELVETEEDVDKTPKVYHIILKDHDKVKDKTDSKIEYYIHASRVVKAIAEQITLDREGNSSLDTVGKWIQVQEQILRATFVIANYLQAGIQAIKVADEAEATALKGDMKDRRLTRLATLFFTGDESLDDIIKQIIPDLKTGQLTELYLISQKEIATGLGLSIKNLGEEDIPSGFGESGESGRKSITHDRVHHIQNHYSRFMEECFFKLGKEDTVFEWIQPEIEEQRSDFQIGLKREGDSDKNGNENGNEKIDEENNQEEND